MATDSKRYEFTGVTKEFYGRTLRQIRSLVSIAALGVSPGDLGGWIETEENLPQSGSAWVFPNVMAYGKATFWGGTFRGGTFEGGTFRGGTFWGGTFKGGTFEGGTFRGGTFEGGTFRGGTFWGGTSTNKQPIFLAGLRWEVTITDAHMVIGCQSHLLKDWWSFDDKRIARMDVSHARDFWSAYKPFLQALCRATGRPAGDQ